MSERAVPTATEIIAATQELSRDQISAADVAAALDKIGISNLDRLIEDVLENRPALAEVLDVFTPDAPSAPRPNRKRPVPTLPFTVADTLYDPGDIDRFAEKPLHFVYRSRVRGPELIGFTGTEWLRALSTLAQWRLISGLSPTTRWAGGSATPPPYWGVGHGGTAGPSLMPGPEAPSLVSLFYGEFHFKGPLLKLTPNRAWSNLTQVSMVDLKRFRVTSWNDEISSVHPNGATLLLFEAIHFGGDSMVVFDPIADLGTAGWNERVSSIKNFGEIY